MKNGLRVLLIPDSTAPVVGVGAHYDVGFRSEPEGLTGFAHLFEHLMFQGSESLGKMEHCRHVESAGGMFNGQTHPDYTDFHQVVPSAALEQALFMEADRMRAPSITEENLRNQIDVVKEEIRLNVLNRPYGGFPFLWLPPVLYTTFANSHNGYGDFTDLENATVEDCAEFFDTFYSPANALLTVIGDFVPQEVEQLVDRHFSDLPARAAEPKPAFAEPLPTQERRGIHDDPHAPLPALAVGYRLPDPVTELDAYLAHLVLTMVLTDGDGARLQQRMVHRQPLVSDISSGLGLFRAFDARDPDLLRISALHVADVSADQVLDAIDEELDSLATTSPSQLELRKTAARWTVSMHRAHDRMASRTQALGAFELLFGDAGLVSELPGRIAAVTPEAVSAAAKSLRPDSRAVLTVNPVGGAR